jgi:UDP-4-keto-D-QuiNAc 4-reductase
VRHVLVTGANGFVGRKVCELAARDGLRVRAVARELATLEPGLLANAARVGAIDGGTDWAAALRDVDTVVHAAARVHVMNAGADALPEFRRVNVDGTRRLAEAAAKSGVGRLVYVSSIKVNGERTVGDGAFREDDAPQPSDPYGISKLEAERALLTVAAQTGLEVTIVRPPLVYGPHVRANFLALMRAVDRGMPLPLGAVANRRSLVAVENLAHLLLLCGRHSNAGGRLFLAADARPLSTAELVRLLAAALGRSARLLPVPPAALRLAGTLIGRTAQVARLCDSLRIDTSLAERVLGWRAPLSVEDGLRQAAAWYRTTAAGGNGDARATVR